MSQYGQNHLFWSTQQRNPKQKRVKGIIVSDILNVTVREERGSSQIKRLRNESLVPAVLYGAGKENICLSVSAKELNNLINNGTMTVSLAGGVTDKVAIKQVQWDVFGREIQHVDFTRIS